MRNPFIVVIVGIFLIMPGMCSTNMAIATEIPSYYKTYETPHFTIYSNMDPLAVVFVEKNIEAFYENMLSKVFPDTPRLKKKIRLYYSGTRFDSGLFFWTHKVNNPCAAFGLYVHETQELFAHWAKDDEGTFTEWGALYHEIAHYFIAENFTDPPDWFDEGLAAFLGEYTNAVKGDIPIGNPSPWRAWTLRKAIEEEGLVIDISRLVSPKDEQGYSTKNVLRYCVARSFFFWLYDKGKLNEYLRAVKKNGYGLEALEKLGLSREEINKDWLALIKTKCYAGAYLWDSMRLTDASVEKKVKLLSDALELYPDYDDAIYILGKVYYVDKQYKLAEETLNPILSNPKSTGYADANAIVAKGYQDRKDYETALEYYWKSIDYLEYNALNFITYYLVSKCYRSMGNKEEAKKWLQKCLDEKWGNLRLR